MTYIIQIIIHLPLRIYYKLFWRLEIRGQKNFAGLRGPVLLVSNHKSLHDPWLIGSSLPFFSPLLPVWYLAGSKFYEPLDTLYRIGVIPFVYWFFGITPIPREGDLSAKIKPAIDMLSQNKIVIIFPEGKRIFENKLGDFKVGAAEIFLRTNVQIIPIGIKHIKEPNYKIRILFDKNFTPISKTADDITRELHEKIEKLVQ